MGHLIVRTMNGPTNESTPIPMNNIPVTLSMSVRVSPSPFNMEKPRTGRVAPSTMLNTPSMIGNAVPLRLAENDTAVTIETVSDTAQSTRSNVPIFPPFLA